MGRQSGAITAEDHATLSAAVDTLAYLTQELGAKGATIQRLRRSKRWWDYAILFAIVILIIGFFAVLIFPAFMPVC